MYELGRSKRASHAYSFDDVAIAPTRRTRGEDEVDLSWRIDAVTFDVPIVAAPMDSVMSPATAIRMNRISLRWLSRSAVNLLNFIGQPRKNR